MQGATIVDSLKDAEPYMMHSSRFRRNFGAVMSSPDLTTHVTLPENSGLAWREWTWERIEARDVDPERDAMRRTEVMRGNQYPIEPTTIGVSFLVTPKVFRVIDSRVLNDFMNIAMNAMLVKRERDGGRLFKLAPTDLGGAGQAITSAKIGVGATRVQYNPTEPAGSRVVAVVHPYASFDLDTELLQGLTSGNNKQLMVGSGPSMTSYMERYRGKVRGAYVFDNGHLVTDSSDDATNGIYAVDGLLFVQGKMPRATYDVYANRDNATQMYLWDDYAFGMRSKGNWSYGYTTDAAIPS